MTHILSYLGKHYEIFGVQKFKFGFKLDELSQSENMETWVGKPTISFNKILQPKKIEPDESIPGRNVAFLGLTDCDAQALQMYLDIFAPSGLVPKRENIFVLTCECKPDETCFCQALDAKRFVYSDLHLQENDKEYEIFALSKKGEQMLKECGIEKFDQTITIKPIKNQGKKSIDLQKIAANISNKESDEYWEAVSEKCFGCGVCSAVCPLCFCFRNEMVNNPDGSCHTDIYSDSCYSCSFRKTNYKNYGANRSSRMKSWYSHKFERSAARNGKPLCTGCGRCIENCPADLNQFAIISALDEKVD